MKPNEAGTEIDVPKPKGGRPCATCRSPHRAEIERLLVTREATTDAVSAQFGVSQGSLVRHRQNHMALARQEAAQAIAEADAEHGSSLLDQSMALTQDARAILTEATATKQLDVALRAIREVARLLDLSARLTGQISNDTTINLVAAPIVLELQQAVMLGLANFPEAKASVLRELARLSGRDAPLTIEHAG